MGILFTEERGNILTTLIENILGYLQLHPGTNNNHHLSQKMANFQVKRISH